MTRTRHTGPWAHPPRPRKQARFTRALPWGLAALIVLAWIALVVKG